MCERFYSGDKFGGGAFAESQTKLIRNCKHTNKDEEAKKKLQKCQTIENPGTQETVRFKKSDILKNVKFQWLCAPQRNKYAQ